MIGIQFYLEKKQHYSLIRILSTLLWSIYLWWLIIYIYFSLGNKTKASKSTKGKAVKKSRMDEEEMDQEDLTAEMEDPTTENTISEVKVTPANVSRPDMQSQKVKS